MRLRSDRPELWQYFDPDAPGIFSRLESYDVPWKTDIQGEVLDSVYMGTFSGGKPPAPIILRMSKASEGYLTSAQVSQLASMLWNINGPDWEKSWDLEESSYDPISNYDMTEEMVRDDREREEAGTGSTTYGRTDTRTDNLTDGYGSTSTRTDNLSDGYGKTLTRTDNLEMEHTGTDTTAESGSETGSSSRELSSYGLNSSEPVPTDEEASSTSQTTQGTKTETKNLTDTQTGTVTTAESGTDTHTGTSATAKTGADTHTGTQTNAATGTDQRTDDKTVTDSHTYLLTRRGNIGVTTSQEMIEKERTLRAWRLFYDRVFPDIDKMLTLCAYG